MADTNEILEIYTLSIGEKQWKRRVDFLGKLAREAQKCGVVISDISQSEEKKTNGKKTFTALQHSLTLTGEYSPLMKLLKWMTRKSRVKKLCYWGPPKPQKES